MVRYKIKIILFQINPPLSMFIDFITLFLGIGTALFYIIMTICAFG